MSGRMLMEGSAALAEAAIQAGCRFYAGYPITPSTEILEYMSTRLPDVGGVCMNAESEIEAIGMVWGAAGCGVRSMIASTGQGISLMQESFAELANAQIPMLAVNMARGQGDYFQATRGGGHGDYRFIVLAPASVQEAVDLTQLAFHLADKHRAPVIVYGDPLIAQTRVGVRIAPRDFGPLPAKDWALDGTGGGTGHSRQVWTWAMGKATDPGPGPDRHWRAIAAKFDAIAATEARHEQSSVEGAETVVVAFGSAAKFAAHVVDELRDEGHRIGWFRPVTLWPFPGDALADATRDARRVLVFELNAGQMIDDVRIHATDRSTVRPIGGVSIAESGLAYGELMDAPVIRHRIMEALA